VPLERLLIETDAPYLAPVPHRGKTNEPGFVPHVAAMIGQLKGLDTRQVATVSSENFLNLFKLLKKQIKVK
jgi:TatD DNase family protein